MSYRNDLFDKVMKACGIGDKTKEDKDIRRGFHDFLHAVYPDTKDTMTYQELLAAAREYLRSIEY
ncbi:MAG: hypothetical protein LDL41_19440 [Coleofasciculus sp. S288]|nr:hypothetical protein [Coleofasciculus sp. S288]